MSTPGRESSKRKQLSLKEKGEIIRRCFVDKKKQCEVAKEYGVTPAAITKILQRKDGIIKCLADATCNKNLKRRNPIKFKTLDEAILLWLQEMRAKNTAISGPILLAKATEFANQLGHNSFKASQGWLSKFKQRNGVICKAVGLCGEAAAVDYEIIGTWLTTTLPGLLSRFSPSDVYNGSEMGIYFQLLQNRILAIKGEKCSDEEEFQAKITTMVCANMTGTDKQPLLVIGKSQIPRFSENMVNRLGVIYQCSKKACMTTVLFNDWLMQFDVKMRETGRHVLLLIDNCSVYRQTIQTSNVEVHFLPTNTTAILQPLDHGVIQNLKVHYYGLLLPHVIAEIEAGNNPLFKVGLRDALRYLARAWQLISQNTISYGFQKAGCLPDDAVEGNMDEDYGSTGYEDLFKRLCSMIAIPEGVTFYSFITADEEVVAWSGVSNEDLASTALASDQGNDEAEEEPKESQSNSAPNVAEAYRCLNLLRSFVESRSSAYNPKPFNEIDEMLGSIVKKSTAQSTN